MTHGVYVEPGTGPVYKLFVVGHGARESIEVFRVDNIHWARDGSLYAVGQAAPSWKAVKVDPNTLAVREVVTEADAPEFGAGTAVVEVGNTLWVGSFRGNRIVIVPVP